MHNLQDSANDNGAARKARITQNLPPGWAETLLDQIPGAVQLWEPMGSEHTSSNFRLTYANRSAATLLAMPTGMVLNNADDAIAMIQAGDTSPLFSLLSAVQQEGQAKAVPFATEPAGDLLQVNCTPFYGQLLLTFSEAKTKTAISPILPGITALLDKTPRDLINRLQTILSMSQSGVHTFRPVFDTTGEIVDFRINLVNQTIAAYIGQTAEALSGSLASVYFPAYKTNGIFDIYKDCYLTGKKHHFDFHYEDGYDVFFNLQVVKLDDEVLVTLTDHTALKRAQRELEASIFDLKRSNASLEQFAHAASHDLQEPLRKISVFTEKLLDDYSDTLDDKGYTALEKIQTSVRRMLRLVKDLLVFAEVGARKNSLEVVDLDKLVKEVRNDLEVAIAERDATVVAEPLGTITGDEVHLQQLFQNLISNALKYSRPGVPPHIRISATTILGCDTGLELTATEGQQQYRCLSFSDNGQGFTEEESRQIFRIFQRLPQHRTDYSGTGIGLAIVQRVVENHRGYIVAKGQPGKGATFEVILPITT